LTEESADKEALLQKATIELEATKKRLAAAESEIRALKEQAAQVTQDLHDRTQAAADATAAQAAAQDNLRRIQEDSKKRIAELEKQKQRLELHANSSRADLTKMHAQLEFQANEATQDAETLRGQLEEVTAKLNRKAAKVKTLKARLADSESLAEDIQVHILVFDAVLLQSSRFTHFFTTIQASANDTIAKLRDEIRLARLDASRAPSEAGPSDKIVELEAKLTSAKHEKATLLKDFKALQVHSVLAWFVSAQKWFRTASHCSIFLTYAGCRHWSQRTG